MRQARFPRPLEEFAVKAGINIWSLYKIEQGRRATDEQAIAIHRATNGAIPCWELRPDLWSVGQLPPSLALALARLPEAS